MNTANLGGRDNHHIGLARSQVSLHLVLSFEIEDIATGRDDLTGYAREAPHNGGANHPGVTSDINSLARKVENPPGHHAVSWPTLFAGAEPAPPVWNDRSSRTIMYPYEIPHLHATVTIIRDAMKHLAVGKVA